ncbi:MAG: hypothetical protein CM15mP58_16210 [Burkholderiaceae bacterium]|nr:MAG: hypothetical protein CM15mP58_16210 [Burkholderiaceae bacterium]
MKTCLKSKGLIYLKIKKKFERKGKAKKLFKKKTPCEVYVKWLAKQRFKMFGKKFFENFLKRNRPRGASQQKIQNLGLLANKFLQTQTPTEIL